MLKLLVLASALFAVSVAYPRQRLVGYALTPIYAEEQPIVEVENINYIVPSDSENWRDLIYNWDGRTSGLSYDDIEDEDDDADYDGYDNDTDSDDDGSDD